MHSLRVLRKKKGRRASGVKSGWRSWASVTRPRGASLSRITEKNLCVNPWRWTLRIGTRSRGNESRGEGANNFEFLRFYFPSGSQSASIYLSIYRFFGESRDSSGGAWSRQSYLESRIFTTPFTMKKRFCNDVDRSIHLRDRDFLSNSPPSLRSLRRSNDKFSRVPLTLFKHSIFKGKKDRRRTRIISNIYNNNNSTYISRKFIVA